MRFCALSYFVSFYAPATTDHHQHHRFSPSPPLPPTPLPLPSLVALVSVVEAIKDQFSCATVADLNPIIARRFDAN